MRAEPNGRVQDVPAEVWIVEVKDTVVEAERRLLADWEDYLVANECPRRRKCRQMEKVLKLQRELAAKRLVEAGEDWERLGLVFFLPRRRRC